MKWHERFKKRFQQLKAEQGVTQYSLADALGVSQGTVANWLSGSREPRTLADFEKLAGALGVTSEWLMNGESADAPSAPKPDTVPLIPPNLVVKWIRDKSPQSDDYEYEKLLPRSVCPNCSSRTYAIKAMDSGMEPRIIAGDTVFIDPSPAPATGKMIALDFHQNGVISIGELITVGPDMKLKMNNDTFPIPSHFEQSMYRGTVSAVLFTS